MRSLRTRLESLEQQVPSSRWDPEISRRLGLLSLDELRTLESVYKQGELGIATLTETEIAAALQAWEATAHG